jgi:hypothetical protein
VAIPAALSIVMGAQPSRSAEGISLAWNECRSGSGTANQTFACEDNIRTLDLVCAFESPVAVASFVGLDVVVDVQNSAGVLPDWWQMGPKGCRAGEITASADFSTFADCTDPWAGLAGAVVQGYDVGQPRGGASQVRIKAVAGVLPGQAFTLPDGVTHYGLVIRILTARSTGTNSCTGCLAPACLVLNGITLRTLGGSGDITLVTPASPGANWATWRGGAGADCTLVPARPTSWGLIKTLYR